MLRTVLIAVIVGLGLIVLAESFRRAREQQPQSFVSQKHDVLVQPENPSPAQPPNLPEAVSALNIRNSGIQCFSCADCEVKVWEGRRRYRLKGEIYFKKPKNFRMYISSLAGREVDLGSNAEIFWYWSKRDKNPGLYYAKHDDLTRTRLKTPFNPIFMRSSLGLEEVRADAARIAMDDRSVVLAYNRTSATGKPVVFWVYVSRKDAWVDGFVITDQASGGKLVSCDIKSHTPAGLPGEILYTWHEENRTMQVTLSTPVAGAVIESQHWAMPTYQPQIDMSAGVVRSSYQE